MIVKFILLILFFIYPIWLFVKLARYGKGIFHPDFNLMQQKINKWTGFYGNNSIFSYDRTGGKILYYLLFTYLVILFCLFIWYVFR
jgi:hypothetical protein